MTSALGSGVELVLVLFVVLLFAGIAVWAWCSRAIHERPTEGAARSAVPDHARLLFSEGSVPPVGRRKVEARAVSRTLLHALRWDTWVAKPKLSTRGRARVGLRPRSGLSQEGADLRRVAQRRSPPSR